MGESIKITKDISLIYKDIPIDETTTIVNTVEGTFEKDEIIEKVEDTFETATNFKTKLTIEKIWQGDKESDRPAEVTIRLLANGELKETTKLTSEQLWTVTFDGLDKYDENKQKIEYSVEEDVPEGYYLSSNEKTLIEGEEKHTLTNFKYGKLTITKVAEEDHTIALSGTEFKLYKLTGDKNLSSELIDIDNVSSDWTLVGTYVTNDNGLLEIESLPKTSEYRLVETKAPTGRIMPNGQWKIEFIYGDYDENDTSIKDINGTLLRVTAVGNPPAMAIENGKLLLPNRELCKLPSTGDVGPNDFYKIGIIMATMGIIILMLREKRTHYKCKH